MEASSHAADLADHEAADSARQENRLERESNRNDEADLVSTTRRGYRLRRALFAVDVAGISISVATVLALGGVLTGASRSAPADLAVVICLPVWFLYAYIAGLYHAAEKSINAATSDEVGRVVMVTTAWLWLLLLVGAAAIDRPLAISWFFALWLLVIATSLGLRVGVRRIVRDRPWYRQAVVVVGTNEGANRVLSRITRHPECGLDPVGLLALKGDRHKAVALAPDGSCKGFSNAITELGSTIDGPETAAELLKRAGVQRAVVAEWGRTLDDRTALMRVLATSGIFVDIVAGEPEALCADASIHSLEGVPIMTVRPSNMTKAAELLKRAMDIIGSGCALILLVPLFAYISIRIKLDSPGPVLFRQTRAGRGSRTFVMLKFRTMRNGADQEREVLRNGAIGMFKLKEDPRITRYGAQLRRRSFDELPQLWNVFIGEMSLVGPRPLPLDEAHLAERHFSERQRLRPGITGPWQINGRSDIPFDDMVKLDYMYVTRYSLSGDCRLLFRTIGAVASGRGAY